MTKTVHWFVYSGRNNFLVVAVDVDRALYVEKCGVVTFDIIMNEPFNRKNDNSFQYLADVGMLRRYLIFILRLQSKVTMSCMKRRGML